MNDDHLYRDAESGSKRIPRSLLLRGKRANGEHFYSLRIGASPQFTAEGFNILGMLMSSRNPEKNKDDWERWAWIMPVNARHRQYRRKFFNLYII